MLIPNLLLEVSLVSKIGFDNRNLGEMVKIGFDNKKFRLRKQFKVD